LTNSRCSQNHSSERRLQDTKELSRKKEKRNIYSSKMGEKHANGGEEEWDWGKRLKNNLFWGSLYTPIPRKEGAPGEARKGETEISSSTKKKNLRRTKTISKGGNIGRERKDIR